jgi:CheY-like chemotaxis protein
MRCILIVDDHEDIRRLIRLTLEFAGHGGDRLVEAADGESALALARLHRPDIILTDVMMPGTMSGLDLCREVSADPLLADTAVILISAAGQSSDRSAGLDSGAVAYLVKPISPLELIRTLESMGACA